MSGRRVLPPRPPKHKVHNHGPDEGPGLDCPEKRNILGQLQGACMRAGDLREGIGPGMASPKPQPRLPCPCRHPERHPEEHDWSRFTLVEETITVDGVVYDVEKIRALLLERHQLADELRLVNDTLRHRSEALNRVATENERLRAKLEPAPQGILIEATKCPLCPSPEEHARKLKDRTGW